VIAREVALAAAIAAAVGLAAGCAREPTSPGGRYNLLLIVLDTLRADHLGSYGYERDTSPHLDAFAARGVRFANAQSAAPWTAPSLLSLMTSLHPDVHQVIRYPNPGRLSRDVVTLAEVLQRAGYATAAFTEGGYAKGEFGLDQGFDVYPSNPGDDESHGSNRLYPSRIHANVGRTLEWIRAHRDERFFAFFQTYETHTPYRAPEKWIRRFRPEFVFARERQELAAIVARWDAGATLSEADWNRLVLHDFHCLMVEAPLPQRPGLYDAVRKRVEPFDDGAEGYPPEVLAGVRDLYDAEIAYTDQQVSRLWTEIARLGLEEETIVVVIADHGEGLGDHGWVEHGKTLTEEILRVALVMRFPDALGYRGTVDALVRSVDVMPTLLDALGVSRAGLALQGEPLQGVLAGGDGAEAVFSHAVSRAGEEDGWRSVRTARWRLVLRESDGEAWLYDLLGDPGERTNVADRFPDVASELREQVRAQHARDVALRDVVSGEVEPAEIDPELRRELEALGYLE